MIRAAGALMLLAACGSTAPPHRSAPPRSPTPTLDCQQAGRDEAARDRCVGFVLDQFFMSALFRPYGDPLLAFYVGRIGRRGASCP